MFRLVSIDLSCQSHLMRRLAFHFLRLRPLLLRAPCFVAVLCPGMLMAVVEVVWLGPMLAGWGGLACLLCWVLVFWWLGKCVHSCDVWRCGDSVVTLLVSCSGGEGPGVHFI